MKYKYSQSGQHSIFKRIPVNEDDHMRICMPYQDEYEYSANIGVQEALEAGLSERKDIILYVLKKYKGHLMPDYVTEILDRNKKSL